MFCCFDFVANGKKCRSFEVKKNELPAGEISRLAPAYSCAEFEARIFGTDSFLSISSLALLVANCKAFVVVGWCFKFVNHGFGIILNRNFTFAFVIY